MHHACTTLAARPRQSGFPEYPTIPYLTEPPLPVNPECSQTGTARWVAEIFTGWLALRGPGGAEEEAQAVHHHDHGAAFVADHAYGEWYASQDGEGYEN